MIAWKPHHLPDPEWPDYVQRMYLAGCEKIDRLRKQMEPDNICPIPFQCWGCDKIRSDFAMITGDGIPICVECLGFLPAEEMVRCSA